MTNVEVIFFVACIMIGALVGDYLAENWGLLIGGWPGAFIGWLLIKRMRKDDENTGVAKYRDNN